MPLETAHARLPHSRFTDVDLQQSAFDDVNLRQAAFTNVALTGATFRNVCLGEVSIADANLQGMRIDGVLVTDLQRAYAQWRAAAPDA